ncbi:MAG: MotA/TolQ/ExbB proton channel family protein [Oscillatoriales cyanobacterium SM2_2_1]|nr:MotA/TolQ/ExbB proton channel family protein [Oscillatoriales cyanobacterium SM2_2_1]
MLPLLGLSVLAVAGIGERVCFWLAIYAQESQVVGRILLSAREDLWGALQAAQLGRNLPAVRVLTAPLLLETPTPELFHLALKHGAERELIGMQRGDRLLEWVMVMAPLLGMIGSVLGLMAAAQETTSLEAKGLMTALTSTIFGLGIATVTVAFYKIFQALQTDQWRLIHLSSNELELIYRQYWQRIHP